MTVANPFTETVLKTLSLIAVSIIAGVIGSDFARASDLEFSAFPAQDVFIGKARLPDFNGQARDFAPFRTRVTDAIKSGVTFAGELSVAQFGCGTGCTTVIVANNRTGELYDFPRGGEFNQALTLEFKPNSKLMLVRWYTDSFWETCVLEAFLFEDGKWIAEEALAARNEEACTGEVSKGLTRSKE